MVPRLGAQPLFKHMTVGQNQWYHFGVGAPPILVYFSGARDVHRGYGTLTHGHMFKQRFGQPGDLVGPGASKLCTVLVGVLSKEMMETFGMFFRQMHTHISALGSSTVKHGW